MDEIQKIQKVQIDLTITLTADDVMVLDAHRTSQGRYFDSQGDLRERPEHLRKDRFGIGQHKEDGALMTREQAMERIVRKKLDCLRSMLC